MATQHEYDVVLIPQPEGGFVVLGSILKTADLGREQFRRLL
jgi:hypothetical protein